MLVKDMLPFLIEKVVVSLETNCPKALREDDIPKNKVVVLFGSNALLGVMSILQEEHAAIKLMHRGISHHDGFP